MPLQDYIDRFVQTPEGEIVASNAADGISIGVHDPHFVRAFIRDVYDATGANDSTSFMELLRLIDDVCLAKMAGIRSYFGSCLCGRDYKYPEPRFSVVWPVAALLRLPSPADQERLADLIGRMPELGSDGPGKTPRLQSDTLERLAKLDRAHRYFRLAPGAAFSDSLVWFTLESLVSNILSAAGEAPRTKADVCRDLFGLIHRQPTPAGSYLVALHLPAGILTRVPHTRPTFVEAGSHARFSAMGRDYDVPSHDAFGRTVDLEHLVNCAGLCDGVPERVAAPFGSEAFDDDDTITFDFLGPITIPRGTGRPGPGQCADDTTAFAQMLRAGRTAASLLSTLV